MESQTKKRNGTFLRTKYRLRVSIPLVNKMPNSESRSRGIATINDTPYQVKFWNIVKQNCTWL